MKLLFIIGFLGIGGAAIYLDFYFITDPIERRQMWFFALILYLVAMMPVLIFFDEENRGSGQALMDVLREQHFVPVATLLFVGLYFITMAFM